MKVTELQGRAHVFTLKNGKTFRILSRQTKEVAESNVSNEMRIAEKMGLILITEIVSKNKKGGTK